jgi:hypothetical protein
MEGPRLVRWASARLAEGRHLAAEGPLRRHLAEHPGDLRVAGLLDEVVLRKCSAIQRLLVGVRLRDLKPMQFGATWVVGSVLLIPLALAAVAALGATRLWLWTDAQTRAHRARGEWVLPLAAAAWLVVSAGSLFDPLPGIAPASTWVSPWWLGGLPVAAFAGLRARASTSRDLQLVALTSLVVLLDGLVWTTGWGGHLLRPVPALLLGLWWFVPGALAAGETD